MQDRTEIKFQNTCTIDNWIALPRVIHIDHPIVFDEMLHVSSCLTPPLCKILALIKATKFNEAKLDIAQFNQIKSSGDVIDFYGSAENLLIKMLSILYLCESHSICGNLECPEREIVKFVSSYPAVSYVVQSEAQFIQCVTEWLFAEKSSTCLMKYTHRLPGEHLIKWMENKEQ